MEKLYFLVPNIDSAYSIVADFHQNGIDEKNIHLVANSSTRLDDLPEASPLVESDFVPALQRGVALGGATGLLAGVMALAFPPAGLTLGGGAVLGSTLGGASFGAWAASMIGASTPNSHLRSFENAIAEGQILILVEVEQEQVDDIQALIKQRHPEADIQGSQNALPPLV